MKSIVHSIYKAIGHIICRVRLCLWTVRDCVHRPTEKAILFVAHPDDDALFFHTFIQENKPYVCLMTTGWSLRRMACFSRMMKMYGVRYRAYDMETDDSREELLTKRVRKMLATGSYSLIATHNSEGEYGHEMHQRLHRCVKAAAGASILCPVSGANIKKHPLPAQAYKEKQEIFEHIYTTERFVLEQYAEWVSNEKLEIVE